MESRGHDIDVAVVLVDALENQDAMGEFNHHKEDREIKGETSTTTRVDGEKEVRLLLSRRA